MGENTPSVSDIRAVMDASNGSNGFAYPYPMYGGGFGNSFGGDGGWLWLIVILALFGGFNGNGNGFGNGFNNDYAWLSNGQKEIMQNTNDGFNTLHLSNQIDSISNGINSLSNQLCNCCADMNSTVSNGFYNAEISANNRQMADMQQSFALSTQLANASTDNRLGIANLNSTILAENCADRAALADGLKDVLINQTANTQKILDTLCQDKIDAKNEKIADLQRELQMADLKASQIEQNAFIASNLNNEIDLMYNRLVNCPIPSTPVYGRTPIFTCNNNGCGCGNFNGSI